MGIPMLLKLIPKKSGTMLWLIGLGHDVWGGEEVCGEFESSAVVVRLFKLEGQDQKMCVPRSGEL